MYRDKSALSVLIVSSSVKAEEYLRDILDTAQFSPVVTASGAGEAKRMQLENHYDLVLINAPLADDFVTELAIEIAEDSASGVILFVKNELFEQVSYKAEDYGVLTVAKPGSRQGIYQAIKLLVATRHRIKTFENKAVTLEAKMKEIRLINRAKWLLIDRFKMSETEAHKYIEKTAMDNCVKRGEIAENIIRTYEG